MRRASTLMRVRASTLHFGGVSRVGESEKQPFQLSLNRVLRVAFQGSRVTSNGGPILVRDDNNCGYIGNRGKSQKRV
jgi:hypothetical protein